VPGKKKEPPLSRGLSPFCEATRPRLNPAAVPASGQPPEKSFRRETCQSYFFLVFLGAFFFIALFNLDLDFGAFLATFFFTPGIDTSSLSAAAGEAPFLLGSLCYL
jgi:hypothetical protein